jgi:YHS domain-containing protein
MRIIFTLLLFTLCARGFSQTAYYSTKSGVAINGYDPVAYFTDQKAVPGKDQFSWTWQGSTWKFASQAHLDSFKQAPEQFAPQYGGFCAFGCSENHKAPTDPKSWTIVGGKLYLNYDAGVKSLWIKDTTNRIKLADGFWPALNK